MIALVSIGINKLTIRQKKTTSWFLLIYLVYLVFSGLSRLFWFILDYSRLHSFVHGLFRLLWFILIYSGLFWFIQIYSGLFWFIQIYFGLFWFILIYSGLV